ncbi:hypothetical protein LO762_22205 [Actinocorallia sp. API 0066]|uniref:hypothetical protein n=1 Tax=Actinocorallia sp. API 0066 TaxID=2896846 RepID=UPI001E2B55DD|nr:hypothetical protein [Actinocorallia sp. API 0066]MCD0451889.1 hypothetical protein [Actinocorallia sp. API 0066]
MAHVTGGGHGRSEGVEQGRTRGLGAGLALAVLVGAVFGAGTSGANELSHRSADLESAEYTTSGWSPAEVLAIVLDSGWAWAGLAVFTGFLVTRGAGTPPGRTGTARPLTLGCAAGAISLLVAVAAYSLADALRDGGITSSWYESEAPLWWIAAVVLGGPLGAVGARARDGGVIGLLARLTVPVGAALQMVVLPPGRNAVVTTIGQTVVGVAALVAAALAVASFRRDRRAPDPARPT